MSPLNASLKTITKNNNDAQKCTSTETSVILVSCFVLVSSKQIIKKSKQIQSHGRDLGLYYNCITLYLKLKRARIVKGGNIVRMIQALKVYIFLYITNLLTQKQAAHERTTHSL